MPTSQTRKEFLHMAGEFLVAGELNRRSVLSSITFGSSKSADIYAFAPGGNSIARIEVKCTDKNEWPVGKRILDKSVCQRAWFWVFVHLPPSRHEEEAFTDELRGKHSPRYFILNSSDVHEIALESFHEYQKAYFSRHGKEFNAEAVHTVKLQDVLIYENEWHQITSFVTHHLIKARLNRPRS